MPHLPQDRLALVRQLYESSELTIAEIAVLADVSESAIYQRARRERWTNTRRPGVTPRKSKLRPPVPPTPALLAVTGLAVTGRGGGQAQPAPSVGAHAGDATSGRPAGPGAGTSGGGTADGAAGQSAGRAGANAPADSAAADSAAVAVRPFADVDRAETARRLWRAVNRHLETLEADEAPDTVIRAAQNLATLARTLETLIDVERGLQAEKNAQAPAQREPEDIEAVRHRIARRLDALCTLAGDEAEPLADGLGI